MPYCSQCGGEIADGARFCRHCGNATDGPPVANPVPSRTPALAGSQSDSHPAFLRWGCIGCVSLVGLLILAVIIGVIAESVRGGESREAVARPTPTSIPPSPTLTPMPTPEGTVIGRWRDVRPFFRHCITITENAGEIYLYVVFDSDGSSDVIKMEENPSSLGRRFDFVESWTGGDHYIIAPEGHLQIWDDLGQGAVAHESDCP